jgi:hypothetical protein
MLKRILAKLDDLVWVQCKLLSQLSQSLIPFQSGYRPPWLETRAQTFFLVVSSSCSLALCASMNSELVVPEKFVLIKRMLGQSEFGGLRAV